MRIPGATYRIQFCPDFDFTSAREIVPYLADLGITDLYASPVFRARKGSPHGYDIVDPNEVSPELGSGKDFESLSEILKRFDMGWLQDIVPNHMAFDYDNPLLMDVLENGEHSDYVHFFDIEWDHPYESMRGRLLAPFLGAFFGESLERGEIRLLYDETGFRVTYYDMSFPLKTASYIRVLTLQLERLKRTIGGDHPDFSKLLGIIHILGNLSSVAERHKRYDRIAFVKKQLWELYNQNEQIKKWIENALAIFNGKAGDPRSFQRLDRLLSEQYFRLSFWKVATEELNYRRFFNVNELISVRVEEDSVFQHTHALVFRLLKEGKVSGLRVDHIDGLYDPTQYLKRLRENLGDIYLIVEKILGPEEELPLFWPVQGTTGYDFLNMVNGLFCKMDHEKRLSRIYDAFTNARNDYKDIVRDKKELILAKHMTGDIDNLAHLLKRMSSRDRYAADITLHGLRKALLEIMASFPVYRTYVSGEHTAESDAAYVHAALEEAIQKNPGLSKEFRFIERFLLLQYDSSVSEEDRAHWLHFVMRFQQLTGPLMAKGLEDTTFYVYNRLLSLNEVGGDPGRFGVSLEDFHRFNKRRAALWPHALSATSTHDTKRGEDVRARLNVLSEIPDEWEKHLKIWRRINRRKKTRVNGIEVPDRNDEYFLYQTIIGALPHDEGAYPQFLERLKEYLIKAVREAKVHTAWLKPDNAYEEAYVRFADEILKPAEGNPFLKEFLPFQHWVSHFGILNALSQIAVKLTAPGVPDFYQGTELWDLNLVDPDNRRPVDFQKRQAFLKQIMAQGDTPPLNGITSLLSRKEDGRIKLFLIFKLLRMRRKNQDVFQQGTYDPLEVSGKFKDHVIVFLRTYGRKHTVTIAPRFLTALVGEGEYPMGREVWHDTCIIFPKGFSAFCTDIITGKTIKVRGRHSVGEILRQFPVSVLLCEESA